MQSYRRGLVLWICVLTALLVGPVLAATVAPVASDVLPNGSPVDSSTTRSASNAETLGPPDWPAEPLDPSDVPGRYDISNTSEYPYATVGRVGTATGVLVSDYHVLTAAHVVTDSDGEPSPTAALTFTPGYRKAPNESAEAPFGTANVTELYIHPDWAGDPPDDDLALLVLDRPIGADAGSMAIPSRAIRDVHSRDLRQAGYVHNVTGTRLIGSTPTPQQSARGTDDGYLYYCGPLSHGDSGSPIWTGVDGRATIVGVNSAWDTSEECTDGAVGIRLDDQRLDRIRGWMVQDDRPEPKADPAAETHD